MSPFLHEAIEPNVVEVATSKYGSDSDFRNILHKFSTGWPVKSLTEDLYSAAGVQSAILSEFTRRELGLDINDVDSKFLIETISSKWGNKYFEVRPSSSLNLFASFYFKETSVGRAHDMMVSLPLFCKITGLSMNELEYKNYFVQLKPEYTTDAFIDHIFHDYYNIYAGYKDLSPNEDPTLQSHFVMTNYFKNNRGGVEDSQRNVQRMFRVITMISMGLCFFSLSSSMSANIQEQSREISLLLALGMRKTSLVKLYIYEALVLVLSSSIVGFAIGLFIGNIMILQ